MKGLLATVAGTFQETKCSGGRSQQERKSRSGSASSCSVIAAAGMTVVSPRLHRADELVAFRCILYGRLMPLVGREGSTNLLAANALQEQRRAKERIRSISNTAREYTCKSMTWLMSMESIGCAFIEGDE